MNRVVGPVADMGKAFRALKNAGWLLSAKMVDGRRGDEESTSRLKTACKYKRKRTRRALFTSERRAKLQCLTSTIYLVKRLLTNRIIQSTAHPCSSPLLTALSHVDGNALVLDGLHLAASGQLR